MPAINFSVNGDQWQKVTYDGSFSNWLETENSNALECIARGGLKVGNAEITGFSTSVFKKKDIKVIFDAEKAQLGLRCILADTMNSVTKTALIAVRYTTLEDNEAVLDGNPMPIIGPPASINFGNAQIESEKIKFITEIDGLNWTGGNFGPSPVGDWLSNSRKQDRLRRSVDMMTLVRFKKEEINHLLENYEYLAFCLVVFECDCEEPIDKCCYTFSQYSTLMVLGVKTTDNEKTFEYAESGSEFLVSSDAWRPNYKPASPTCEDKLAKANAEIYNLKQALKKGINALIPD